MTARVFIIHEPARWDNVERKMVPFDLSSVDEFGERFVIFPGGNRPPPWAKGCKHFLNVMSQYQEGDFLVIAGDMDLLVWASVLALKASNGKLNLLRWNSRQQVYEVCSAPTEIWSRLNG